MVYHSKDISEPGKESSMKHELTIDQIEEEALALEIDISFARGIIVMHKRGASEPHFVSSNAYDQPGVLEAALVWLKSMREMMEFNDKRRQ
jgi:hypothetical protein